MNHCGIYTKIADICTLLRKMIGIYPDAWGKVCVKDAPLMGHRAAMQAQCGLLEPVATLWSTPAFMAQEVSGLAHGGIKGP
ncbi:hypothetical protein [Limnohabitans sp. DM1]|uniref:hypothetical protein n=1 Tax=Limnohabitans sp. DM1 TaxID=1597955 RepID=UPI000A7CF2EA|nr:hypothetical protein [Limnohabitans sp. DM1]